MSRQIIIDCSPFKTSEYNKQVLNNITDYLNKNPIWDEENNCYIKAFIQEKEEKEKKLPSLSRQSKPQLYETCQDLIIEIQKQKDNIQELKEQIAKIKDSPPVSPVASPHEKMITMNRNMIMNESTHKYVKLLIKMNTEKSEKIKKLKERIAEQEDWGEYSNKVIKDTYSGIISRLKKEMDVCCE